jgi:ABC-type oligopeptide transport system, periplasmic component
LADALNKDVIDASPVTLEQYNMLSKDKFNLVEFSDTTWVLCLNNNTKFSSYELRSAFTGSIDKDMLDSKAPDMFYTANAIIPPASNIYGKSVRDKENQTLPEKDEKKARETLEEYMKQNEYSVPPNVNLYFPEDEQMKKALTTLYASWQQSLGVYINLSSLPLEELIKKVETGDFDMAIIPVRGKDETPESLLSMFMEESSENFCGFKSEIYDDLVKNMTMKPEEEQRQNTLEAEQMLINSSIIYPLFYEKRLFVYSKKISGIIYKPFDAGVDFISTGKDTD